MRVLVIQTAFLGDAILTTPLLETVRALWPGSELDVVATPEGCRMIEGIPGVTCHALDKRGLGIFAGLRAVRRSLGEDVRFDVVLCVHRSLRSLWLGRTVAAQRRIGFKSVWAGLFGYETVPYPASSDAVHYAAKALALLAPLGVAPAGTGRPRLEVPGAAAEAVRKKLATFGGRPYVVLAPFSVWGTKMWPSVRYSRLGAVLAERHGLPIVIIGDGGREQVIGDAMADGILAAGGRAVSLVGRTSLAELKAVVRGARLLVCNDSAPVHVASAFNVPTVAIFGPTTRRWGFFPLSDRSVVVERPDLACRPCHIHGPPSCPKGHFRCMEEIRVEDVASAAGSLVSS